ncbi:hypothetical protein RRG08_023901 [Elysia crispata]|uniref:Acireductone dioxygenase n=1 Tax=Elysia crispata TaxID=231223 RepID=A0AAE1AEA7_9GAST|nr:hypothetical protein RRG08_023901 [Elysia crispata]
MVLIWQMKEPFENPNLPNKTEPVKLVAPADLHSGLGVECMKFNVENSDINAEYVSMKQNRGYNYEDEVNLVKGTSNEIDKIIEEISREHIHADDEMRMVLDGSGYFDVRDKNDKWIRIETKSSDMLIIPSGMYHRFVLDQNNYMKCKRLFKGSPVWTAFFRPDADNHAARKAYLKRLANLK